MKIARNTPEEEARIQAGIDADPDNPELDDDFFANAVRVADMTEAQLATMVPGEVATAERRRRGAQRAPTKQLVSLRLGRDVIDALRAGGPGWQSRAEALLRKAVGL